MPRWAAWPEVPVDAGQGTQVGVWVEKAECQLLLVQGPWRWEAGLVCRWMRTCSVEKQTKTGLEPESSSVPGVTGIG